MKKLVLPFILAWFLLLCGTARAGHWVATGVFELGIYMTCVVNDGIPIDCIMTVAEGTDTEVQHNVDSFNDNIMMFNPDSPFQVMWYQWGDNKWNIYKVPWQYVEGPLI